MSYNIYHATINIILKEIFYELKQQILQQVQPNSQQQQLTCSGEKVKPTMKFANQLMPTLILTALALAELGNISATCMVWYGMASL